MLQAFAEKYGLRLKKQSKFMGELAHGVVLEQKVHLLLPMTYMNLSGQAVRKAVDFYGIALDHILIVTDDISLPFGKLRLRPKGSAGGHNGLKSVEQHLQSQHYSRLRLGIGDQSDGDLADYVLAEFTSSEKDELPKIIDEGVSEIETWVTKKGTYEESKTTL